MHFIVIDANVMKVLLVNRGKAIYYRVLLFICSEALSLRWAVLEILMYCVYTPVSSSVRLALMLLTTINRGPLQ
ncbi:MAG: hypothetical protein HGA70_07950 [Chlorobiaceae bacterium]|nr:hypothetical protein [Chlorobiaceae bacterium]